MGSITPDFASFCNLFGSDSRSAGTIEDRIRPALESGSKVGSKKPVLVIIDEIDGATGGNDHVSARVAPFRMDSDMSIRPPGLFKN